MLKTTRTCWRDLLLQVRLLPFFALLAAAPLQAQSPNLINYQGRLTDAQGNPVTGNRTMIVKVYDAPIGGNLTYQENIGTVAVTNGTYSFQFGDEGDGIIAVLIGFSDYLSLTVNGTEEAARTRLLAVPYSLKSADAQALRDELVAVGVLTAESGGSATLEMITVQGGTLPQSSELAGQMVANFLISNCEVNWGEWQEVRTWAVTNGYTDLADLAYVGAGSAVNQPVHSVSWYDVVTWCNAKSQKEGLVPVYQVGGAVYKTGRSEPTVNNAANGYRLPLEKEWEWVARGGVNSQGYAYSGSDNVNAVAWYSETSGFGTKAVGTKAANELAIFDMSGNVWEWCWDVYDPNPPFRRIRGGSWSNTADLCTASHRGIHYLPDHRDNRVGFRLARNAPQPISQ